MALSDVDLREHRNRRFVIEPWKDTSVTPTGYDLRFGFGIVLPDRPGDDARLPAEQPLSGERSLTIPEGRGALLVTVERIFLSGKVMGTIHGKARWSATGLITPSVTVDPNFGAQGDAGRLFLYFFNSSKKPIQINEKQPIATMVLTSLDTETLSEPKTRTYEDVMAHWDTHNMVGGSTQTTPNRLCDPIRIYLASQGASNNEGEKNFNNAVAIMKEFRASINPMES